MADRRSLILSSAHRSPGELEAPFEREFSLLDPVNTPLDDRNNTVTA